ncbi:MAG: VTT domain-containing protein [Phycisphaeraceae bacterium]
MPDAADTTPPRAVTPPAPPAGDAPAWRTTLRRLGPVGVLGVISLTLPPLGGFVLLLTMAWVGPFLHDLQLLGTGLYVVGFIVLAGLALLPTYAQALLGGYAFGFGVGFPAALAGFIGASLLAYALAGRIAGERLMNIIHEKPKWQAVHHELVGSGFWRTLAIVILIRLPPNSPFAATNVVMASANVAWLPYALGTAMGMAPRTGAAVFLAAAAGSFDVTQPSWLLITGVAVAIAVVIIIGLLANRAVNRITNGGGNAG